jgi:uncharacterized protein
MDTDPDAGRNVERIVVWRSLHRVALERCVFASARHDYSFEGTVLTADPPLEVRYEIVCDRVWRTRSVRVRIEGGDFAREIELECDGHGVWRDGSRVLHELDGCHDVDLSVTPATNTLPIRRLELPIGASASVTAAWIRIPEWTVQPLDQRYTRLEARRYVYESPGFQAELELDDLSLVERYGELWARVGEAPFPLRRDRSGSTPSRSE